jgi:N-glycosylase/DNA lyase
LGRAQKQISAVLSESGYPYFRLRADHICRTFEAFYVNGSSIKETLFDCETVRVARHRIVDLAYGIGPKQASLFLTLIGFTNDFSILDVHVMRYLAWMDFIPSPSVNLNTLRKYEEIEDIFLRHAKDLSVSAGDLDLAVWIVTRTAKKEFQL